MQDVIELEQYFGMSHLAMLWRPVSEKYLTKAQLDQYSDNVAFTAKGLGYDDRLYKPSPAELQKRTYGYYLKQVESLREKDLVSAGKIEELLLDAYRDDLVSGEDVESGGTIID